VDAELRARIAEAVARRFGEETEPPEIDRGAETLARLLGRASCRKFRPDPVEPALLQLVCAAALSAPTKSDLQQADVLNVTDPALRAQIAALVPTMPRVREAPAFLVFLANGRRIRQVAELRRKPFANDHLDAFLNAAVDAAIVLGTFSVAAEAVGLGTCAISVIGDRIFELAELLGLPELVVPVAGMCVGWPAHVPPPHPRLPLGLTLHENRFDDGRLAELVEAYDRRRAALDPCPRQRGVERFGEAECYGWSEEKARHYAEPQRLDFGRFERTIGFRLD
jgi:nitroreductase/FMN reductase [NAD(P)H]